MFRLAFIAVSLAANQTLTATDEECNVFVFCGQSNSQGWALLKGPVPSDERVEFLDQNNEWVPAKEPLNPKFYDWTPPPVDQHVLLQRFGVKDFGDISPREFLEQLRVEGQGPLGGVGPGLFFATHLLQHVDRRIGIMHCGVGGSHIVQWDPGKLSDGYGKHYREMLKRIEVSKARVKAIIFYQGETNAMSDGGHEGYEDALLRIVDGVRKDLDDPELPFLCVQVGRFVHPYDDFAFQFDRVRDAQRRIMQKRQEVYTVGTIDLPLEDSIHLSFEAYQRLGPRLAEIVLGAVYQKPEHATSIDVKSVEIIERKNRRALIRVEFSGVRGKLTSAGRPTGFTLRPQSPPDNPEWYYTNQKAWRDPIRVVYRVDFDPDKPNAVILGLFDNATLLGKPHALDEPLDLYYGAGLDPYVNIVDEFDNPIPAFGPIPINQPPDKNRPDGDGAN
jgi:sialate O-acetylesterase